MYIPDQSSIYLFELTWIYLVLQLSGNQNPEKIWTLLIMVKKDKPPAEFVGVSPRLKPQDLPDVSH